MSYFTPPPPPPAYGDVNGYQPGLATPPPPSMYQQAMPGTSVMTFGDYPIQCICPYCGYQIVTRIEKKIGLLAWLICFLLCIFFLWLCCFIPFCVNDCKDVEHFCPNCTRFLGANRRL